MNTINLANPTEKLRLIHDLVGDLDEAIGNGAYMTEDDKRSMRGIVGHLDILDRELKASEGNYGF